MKLDYTQSITDNSSISITPASAMTGGGKKQRGGGYVGVSFLPERSIGGLPQRLGYGSACQPVFRSYPDPLYQAGGGKEKPDCDCDESKSPTTMTEKEAQSASLGKLSGLMLGGSPISQFSLISASSSIFAPMGINQLIAIILLLFGHAYLTRSSASPKKTSSSHRDRILGGGSVEVSQEGSQEEIRGGGGPLLAPILAPFGPGNLVAIAAILLLHYFATRRERMMAAMKGGGKSMESFQSESLFEKEMKIHQMLGGNSLYRELEESFLTIEPSSDNTLGGGVKGKLRGTREKRKGKIAALIKPIGHAKFKAPGFIRDLKNLFRHYYYTIYKEKSSKKMAGGGLAKGKQMAHSKRAVRSFQRIYDMIAPIAVALKLKSAEKRKKKRAIAKK